MRTYILFLISALAAAPAAAQMYRWVDEHGVTSYGTKPPPGRKAEPVDTTRSRNTIDTGALPKRSEPLPPPRAETPPPPPGPQVKGLDFSTYMRLQRGMSEGELLQRAGRPDFSTIDHRDEVVKSYYWYPTNADPFTTVVTVRGGRVDNIERAKKF